MEMALIALFRKDGEYVIDPVQVDTIVPDYEAFEGPDNFRGLFHELEQATLISRNELGRIGVQESSRYPYFLPYNGNV